MTQPSTTDDDDPFQFSYEIAFEPAHTLEKKLRERWWLFTPTTTSATSSSTESILSRIKRAITQSKIYPRFIGLRVELGETDKQTH